MQLVLNGLYPRWAAKEADGVIVSNSGDQEWICQHYGVAPTRVAVIPQAPPRGFLDVELVSSATSPRLGILCVGQFAFFKAVHVIAQVFDRLTRECPHVPLTWCCAEAHHESARALLSPECRRRVRFVGWLPQDELIHLYDEHSIFLFPSFYEGFGKVFLEAMARGMCVVASRTGGMRDVIRDGKNGFLVPPGDVDETVARVKALADDDGAQAAAMSRAARTTACSYSWERVASETLHFYEERIEARRRGHDG